MTITSRGVYTNLQGTTQPHIAETFTGVQVGDLSVVMLMVNTGQAISGVDWSNGSSSTGDAGYTKHLDADNGTRSTEIWSKIVTSSDLTSGEMKSITFAGWDSEASNAIVWMVLGATNGWSSNTIIGGGTTTSTTGSSPYTIAAQADQATATFAIWGFSLNGTSGGNLTVEYDDEGAFNAPSTPGSGGSGDTAWEYDGWDETDFANNRQGGYKIYQRSATGVKIELTNQHATNKAVAAAIWKESPTVLATGKSGAAASAKTVSPIISPVLATGKSAAAASAKGTLEAPSYLISGKSGAAASCKATLYAPRFVTGKSGAAATAVAATPTVTSVSDVLATGKSAAVASAKAATLLRVWIIAGKSGAAASAKGTVYQLLPSPYRSVYRTAQNTAAATARNVDATTTANMEST